MAISDVSRAALSPTKPFRATRFAFGGTALAKNSEVVSDFLKEAKKTPIQRFKDNFLKGGGLTEESLDALPPEQKAAILRELEEAMKKGMKGATQGTASPGANADVLV